MKKPLDPRLIFFLLLRVIKLLYYEKKHKKNRDIPNQI